MLTVLVIGVVSGCIYALAASGIVVTYQTSGVFNFGQGGIGMIAAWTYWQFNVGWGWPAPFALAVVLLLIAPLFGAITERVLIRPLQGAAVDVTVVVTLALLLGLIGATTLIWDQKKIRILNPFFHGHRITVLGVVIDVHSIIVVVVAVAVAIGLRLFFNRSRIGIAMRGVVDNPDLIAMAGGTPARIQQLSWVLGASLAALAGVLVAPIETLTVTQLTLFVTFGYAAAVMGRLKSLPMTIVGALILGLGKNYAVNYLTSSWLTNVKLIVPMILLFVVLVVMRQERLRVGTVMALRAPEPAGLGSSLIWAVIFVAVAAVVSGWLSPADLNTLGLGLPVALILLSLVLLTGYGGLTSLAQMTFAGLGAFAMGHLGHGGSLIGVLAAIGLAGGVGFLLGLPTLRLRGLYLALATLAFAAAMDDIFFAKIFKTGGSLDVARPHLPGVPRTDRAYFIEMAVVFALAGIALVAVRRGRIGRRLAALDDSPAACATLGVNINWTRLAVFTASAAIAGLGGVLYGGQQGSVTQDNFFFLISLVILLQLRIGGINTVTGAFLGAMFFAMFKVLALHQVGLTLAGHHFALGDLQYVLTGAAAIAVSRDPNGIGGHVADIAAKLRAAMKARRERPGTTPAGTTADEPELVHA